MTTDSIIKHESCDRLWNRATAQYEKLPGRFQIHDVDGDTLFRNDALVDYLGLQLAFATWTDALRWIAEPDVDQVQDAVSRAIKTGSRQEVQFGLRLDLKGDPERHIAAMEPIFCKGARRNCCRQDGTRCCCVVTEIARLDEMGAED